MATLTINNTVCNTQPPATTYGFIYNWWAAIGDTTGDDISDKNLTSSDDWELPDYLDWQTLASHVDPDWTTSVNTVGRQLKETGFSYWNDSGDSNDYGTNTDDFDARGSGIRNNSDGAYSNQKVVLNLWRKEEATSGTDGHVLQIIHSSEKASVPFSAATGTSIDKNTGCSIRLVNNSTSLSDGESGTYIGNNRVEYPTICIGTQEWLQVNLEETKWRDETDIPQVGWDAGGDTEWINATSAAMSVPT